MIDFNERLQIENGDKPLWVVSDLGVTQGCLSSSLPSPTANCLMLPRKKALRQKVWGR